MDKLIFRKSYDALFWSNKAETRAESLWVFVSQFVPTLQKLASLSWGPSVDLASVITHQTWGGKVSHVIRMKCSLSVLRGQCVGISPP